MSEFEIKLLIFIFLFLWIAIGTAITSICIYTNGSLVLSMVPRAIFYCVLGPLPLLFSIIHDYAEETVIWERKR